MSRRMEIQEKDAAKLSIRVLPFTLEVDSRISLNGMAILFDMILYFVLYLVFFSCLRHHLFVINLCA